MLTQFPKILTKNRDSFGNLLDTLNYYLTYGKADLNGPQKEQLKVIAQMAETALFTTKPNVAINNTEGAIVVQILLTLMRGSDSLNDICYPLLTRVSQRIDGSTACPSSVRKHVFGVYLAAIIYNSQAALSFLQEKGLLLDFLTEVTNTKAWRHFYERKLVVVGLSELLLCQNLPQEMAPYMLKVVNCMIELMLKIKKTKEQEIKKREQAEMNPDGADSDDLPSDDSDYSVDDDENVEDSLGFVGAEEAKDGEDRVFGSDDEAEDEADSQVSGVSVTL